MNNIITTIRINKNNLHQLNIIKGNEHLLTYDEVITLLLKEYFRAHTIETL